MNSVKIVFEFVFVFVFGIGFVFGFGFGFGIVCVRHSKEGDYDQYDDQT